MTDEGAMARIVRVDVIGEVADASRAVGRRHTCTSARRFIALQALVRQVARTPLELAAASTAITTTEEGACDLVQDTVFIEEARLASGTVGSVVVVEATRSAPGRGIVVGILAQALVGGGLA